MTSVMDTFQNKIEEHNNKIWDRVGWIGSITPGTAVDVICFKKFGDSIQIWPNGDQTTDYVRHSTWVSEKNGEIVVVTWAVNRKNNFGFYLEELHIPVIYLNDMHVSGDKLIKTLLEHFQKLTCAPVQEAYDAMLNRV